MSDTEPPKGWEKELLDFVRENGPITFDGHEGLMDQIHSISRDEAYSHLLALSEKGLVEARPGDIHEDGTTRDLWYATDRETEAEDNQ